MVDLLESSHFVAPQAPNDKLTMLFCLMWKPPWYQTIYLITPSWRERRVDGMNTRWVLPSSRFFRGPPSANTRWPSETKPVTLTEFPPKHDVNTRDFIFEKPFMNRDMRSYIKKMHDPFGIHQTVAPEALNNEFNRAKQVLLGEKHKSLAGPLRKLEVLLARGIDIYPTSHQVGFVTRFFFIMRAIITKTYTWTVTKKIFDLVGIPHFRGGTSGTKLWTQSFQEVFSRGTVLLGTGG